MGAGSELEPAGSGTDAEEISHRSRAGTDPGPSRVLRRRTVFAVAAVALLMTSIDQTIVATALPAIDHDLHARINWTGWTITVYALGRTMVLPVAGRLSDQYGRRTVFLASVSVFTLASLCCGLATSIGWLIVLRGIQAIGGAAFMPSATGMVSDHFGADRDRAVGMFSSINPIGGIIGPILGGVFVASWSWRGIFLVNVPIGIVLLIVAMRLIPTTETIPRRDPVDWLGMTAMGTGILGAMFGISYLGGTDTTPGSPGFLLPELAAAVAFGVFVWRTRSTETPFIPPRLLAGYGFGTMNIINFLYGSAALGFGALVPLYATQRYGINSLASGTLLIARAIGMITCSGLATMALRRTGYRQPMALGFVIAAAGLVAMAVPPAGISPYAWLAISACLTGLGMGIALPAANNASLQFAPEHVAAVAGLRGTFRQAGQITAVSVTTAIVARSIHPGLAQAWVFAVFGLILVVAIALIARVPEHRGAW